MDQLPDDTAHVTILLGVVDRAQLNSTLAVLGVRGEDRPTTLTLPTDDTTYTSTEAAAVKGLVVTLSYALKTG